MGDHKDTVEVLWWGEDDRNMIETGGDCIGM